MKKSAMIRARIEPAIKEKAEAILKEIGLNASEAIGLFYHQVKLRNGLPFDVNISSAGQRSKIADYSQAVLIEQSKGMTPEERLNAFFNHSYLLKQMEKAGSKTRSRTRRPLKHAC